MIIEPNITDGSGLTWSGDGFRDTRSWRVSDIDASDDAILYEAMLDAEIPRRRDPHPYIPSLIVKDLSASPEGPRSAIITVNYEEPDHDINVNEMGPDDDPQIEVFGTLEETVTDVDNQGAPLYTEHTEGGETVKQGGRVALKVPRYGIRVSRSEQTDPSDTIRDYVGYVNESPWNGGDARTWLCGPISAQKKYWRNSSGLTTEYWIVSYELYYNPKTWDAEIAYIDRETGKPVADWVDGVSRKKVSVLPERSFSLIL